MKRISRTLPLLLLALSLLTVTALADSGPKPQLTVKVENAPEALYYLDLLEEGDAAGGGYLSRREDQDTELDPALVETMLAAVPEGWHACTLQFTSGAPIWGDILGDFLGDGQHIHTFGYVGVPRTYRILIATEDGETWVSDVCTRSALQSSVTVDWAAKTVTVPPAAVGYVLQFCATLLPTLLIEGALLPAFGYRGRKNWKVFLLVNLITQGALALYFSIQTVQSGANPWFLLLLIPAEAVITCAESAVYARRLTGHSKRRAVLYGVTANVCSALLGWYLTEPVWRFVVSIS
jgi:hypothetical protein